MPEAKSPDFAREGLFVTTRPPPRQALALSFAFPAEGGLVSGQLRISGFGNLAHSFIEYHQHGGGESIELNPPSAGSA
jgi:hypothetical protein